MNQDNPCYDIFHCGPSLDCTAHIEGNFNISKIQPTSVKLCCHCACELDSPVVLNYSLKAPHDPYYVVPPLCKLCLDVICHIVVHVVRQNAQDEQDKSDAQAVREVGRQAHVMAGEGAATVTEAHATTPSKSRKRTATMYTLMHYCISYV